eukprot:m.353835 g.353835  ORF g.353835 m.353835 type:complete len:98 (-) comp16840_c0_seq1:1949-2242(-)
MQQLYCTTTWETWHSEIYKQLHTVQLPVTKGRIERAPTPSQEASLSPQQSDEDYLSLRIQKKRKGTVDCNNNLEKHKQKSFLPLNHIAADYFCCSDE